MLINIGHLIAVATLLSLSSAASAGYAGRRLLNANDVLAGISIPSSIAIPAGNDAHLTFLGTGFQHYTFNGTDWVLQNATANLYTLPDNDLCGEHFFLQEVDANGGRPSWRSNDPASLVTAKAAAAVTVDQNSIEWNLLGVTSESGNKDLFGEVTYVQRLKTEGGLPPSTTDGSPLTGDTHSSSYNAIYAFYVSSDAALVSS